MIVKILFSLEDIHHEQEWVQAVNGYPRQSFDK